MIRVPDSTWEKFLAECYRAILTAKVFGFNNITPKSIPSSGGIYLICKKDNENEIPLYIGVSGNLRRRIYQNHLMGDLKASSFKRYLIKYQIANDKGDAKEYIKEFCVVRWIEEKVVRKRGAIEAYLTGIIFPQFGF